MLSFNKNKAAAFIGGFSITTLETWLHSIPFIEIVEKICMTALLGFVGGMVGLLTKDVYLFLKEKIKSRKS